MQSSRKFIVLLLLVAAVATTAFATEPIVGGSGANVFIAIADLENGRVLIPQGAVVPAGVTFHARRLGQPDAFEANADAKASTGDQLVFAYAPDSDFIEARIAIASALQTQATLESRFVDVPENEAGGMMSSASAITTLGTPMYIYFYFADGSYLRVTRHFYEARWAVGGYLYAQGGDYETATLRPKQTSTLRWGPTGGPYFDPYASSRTCYVDWTGGACWTDLIYVPNAVGTVDTSGMITQRFGPCIKGGDPTAPCVKSYSATIRTTVPF